MNIDSIELFHVGLPLRQPLPTPFGPRKKLETVIVAMHGGGAVGWGEAAPATPPWPARNGPPAPFPCSAIGLPQP